MVSLESARQPARQPIVLITGLSTRIDSFQGMLWELTQDFTVHIIETREKSSSRINGKVPFDIETIGKDVAAAIERLELEEGRYYLAGYSLGATAVAACYYFLSPKPTSLILIEPTPVFHYPGWSLFLIRWVKGPLARMLKFFAKWYLTRIVINRADDPEMALISAKNIDNADLDKLRNCILAIAGYEVWDRLPDIDCPTLVALVSKDRLHVHEEIDRVLRSIRHCRGVDLETNRRSHDAEMGQIIRAFVENPAMT